MRVGPGKNLGDPEIQERVEEALTRSPWVDAGEIVVTVVGGIVKLKGTVDSSFERVRADEAASGVSGVVEVVNLLTVPRVELPLGHDPYLDDVDPRHLDWYRYHPLSPNASDARLQEAIEMELFWSPFVDGTDIQVEVEDGVATLTGTVGSLREFRDATENAYEGGAVWVDNELVILP